MNSRLRNTRSKVLLIRRSTQGGSSSSLIRISHLAHTSPRAFRQGTSTSMEGSVQRLASWRISWSAACTMCLLHGRPSPQGTKKHVLQVLFETTQSLPLNRVSSSSEVKRTWSRTTTKFTGSIYCQIAGLCANVSTLRGSLLLLPWIPTVLLCIVLLKLFRKRSLCDWRV